MSGRVDANKRVFNYGMGQEEEAISPGSAEKLIHRQENQKLARVRKEIIELNAKLKRVEDKIPDNCCLWCAVCCQCGVIMSLVGRALTGK